MFERNETIKSETHDNKKGFRIIIKNLDNGEEVVNSVTKANRPHSSLRDKNGKRAWQTPIQKREELLEEIREHKELYHIRFLKKKAA